MSTKFGTLEWSKKNNGVLTPTERLHFLRNMAFLAAREALDAIRDKFGLLKPVDLDFPDCAPPDTQMAREAEVFARETHTQDLLAHGYPPPIGRPTLPNRGSAFHSCLAMSGVAGVEAVILFTRGEQLILMNAEVK